MSKHYEGFGTTLPVMKAERQVALQQMMKRQEEKEQKLHDKIIKKLYVEPEPAEGIAEIERGQGNR